MANYRSINIGDIFTVQKYGDTVRVQVTKKEIICGTRVVRYDYLDGYRDISSSATKAMQISDNNDFPNLH